MLNFLLSDDLRRDPFPFYEQMLEHSPVFQIPDTDVWMIFDYEGVKRALSDYESFTNAVKPPMGQAPDWVLFSDPPRHTKLRAVLLKAFTPRSIANLEPRIRELSSSLLDPIVGRGEIDVVKDYSLLLPALVIADMLGCPVSDQALFLDWGGKVLAMGHHVMGGDGARRARDDVEAVKDDMLAYLREAFEQRRRAPADDLVTRLVEAEVDGERLTEEDCLGFFQLLLAAGTETSTLLIGNTILCLAETPGALARVQASPELLPSVIEEVLRYRGPSQVQLRMTKHDVEMHGTTIPAGKLVLAMLGSANRDPTVFPDPGRFDVARDPNPHIALGYGIHFCMGAALTRLEGRIAVSHILERTQNIELAFREPWPPCKGIMGHGPISLPIRFEPRSRAASPRAPGPAGAARCPHSSPSALR